MDSNRRSAVPDVSLVPLSAAAFAALAAGDLATANTVSPVPLTAHFAGPDWGPVWRRRAEQLVAHPEDADWVTCIIWDTSLRVAVGRAGFHAPPDCHGMVEIGYAVAPAFRRRGYARAAFEKLLERARREPAVRTVRVTISPENSASQQLALPYGFVLVGEQEDDEDGLELVYEAPADLFPAPDGSRPGGTIPG